MSITRDEILQAALNLSERDRLAIVDELVSTLPEEVAGLSVDDPQFLDELDRRKSDGTAAVPCAQALTELREA